MLGRGHSDLTASDSFLFERKERKREKIVWRSLLERTRGYLSSWNVESVKSGREGLERRYYRDVDSRSQNYCSNSKNFVLEAKMARDGPYRKI